MPVFIKCLIDYINTSMGGIRYIIKIIILAVS